MIMIFRKIQDFFNYEQKKSNGKISIKEVVEFEETPDDEETKFEMTITDEIATAAEKKLYEATETINESLLGHKIDMEDLKRKFEELDAPKTPLPEDRAATSTHSPAKGIPETI